MLLRLSCIVCTLAFLSVSAFPQAQETGATDYALGNSSVMWLPRSTALFLNPGELGRLHQDEFYLSSNRFKDLTSMSGAFFLPGIGTLGAGVTPSFDSTTYTLGYGGLIGDYHDFGAAVSVTPKVKAGFRFAFGGAVHLPTSGQNTGLHFGLSLTDLPMDADFSVGAAYWVVPDVARVQVATRSGAYRAEFVGADVRILEGLALQAGTRGFKKVLGGLSYETPYVIAALGVGPEGISFSMNFRISNAASDLHDEAYASGDDAFKEGRYSDARDSFLKAIRYDDYDDTSRRLADRSEFLMDSLVGALLSQARQQEADSNFPDAMKSYAQIMKIDPHQSNAAVDLADVQKKFSRYVLSLLAQGDSLRNENEIDEARQSYELVLDLQPGNDSATVRIAALDALAKQNVRSILTRAETLLRRNRIDDSEKEFKRVLDDDPKNTSARAGLRMIAARRLRAQVEAAKIAYNEKRYFDALQMLLDMIGRGDNSSEIRDLLGKTRDALKTETDRLFKLGLQFYIKEDFKSAIAEWDKVLMIVPSDSSTLEYRKRAEEKLKALQQYQ